MLLQGEPVKWKSKVKIKKCRYLESTACAGVTIIVDCCNMQCRILRFDSVVHMAVADSGALLLCVGVCTNLCKVRSEMHNVAGRSRQYSC